MENDKPINVGFILWIAGEREMTGSDLRIIFRCFVLLTNWRGRDRKVGQNKKDFIENRKEMKKGNYRLLTISITMNNQKHTV